MNSYIRWSWGWEQRNKITYSYYKLIQIALFIPQIPMISSYNPHIFPVHSTSTSQAKPLGTVVVPNSSLALITPKSSNFLGFSINHPAIGMPHKNMEIPTYFQVCSFSFPTGFSKNLCHKLVNHWTKWAMFKAKIYRCLVLIVVITMKYMEYGNFKPNEQMGIFFGCNFWLET